MAEITEKQKNFLVKRNAYVEGMSKEEAHKVISEIMDNKQASIPEKTISYEKNGQTVMLEKREVSTPISSHSPRDASIVAQCLTKVLYTRLIPGSEDGSGSVDDDLARKEVLETYKYFLGELSK